MDQGPVSMMAEICVSGPKCLLSQTSKKWWENTLKSWANVLDMLIWLDTSDPILVERVRTRKKWHLIKDWNDQDALDFNILYRSVYTQLISELTIEANGPEVIRLDTGQLSLNEIIDNVLVALKIKDREVYISR
jgi:hypothetical protein